MGQSIGRLDLEAETRSRLLAGGIATIQALRDATYDRLAACGLDETEARAVCDICDLWLDHRFQAQVLFPMLPEACQFVECAYLELPSDLLVSLDGLGVQYLYELAMSRRARLVARLGSEAVTAVEGALARFQQSYRQGEIVLQIEETEND